MTVQAHSHPRKTTFQHQQEKTQNQQLTEPNSQFEIHPTSANLHLSQERNQAG